MILVVVMSRKMTLKLMIFNENPSEKVDGASNLGSQVLGIGHKVLERFLNLKALILE